jgi:MSHA pilin protein MshC
MRGFTLFELIMVLVIIAILAFMVVPRFSDKSFYDARRFHDEMQSMLRYAQKLAIAQHRNVFVRLDSGRIALCFDSTCSSDANLVRAPAGKNSGRAETLTACGGSTKNFWFCEAPPAGVSHATTPPTAVFHFDSMGKPIADGGSDLPQLRIAITGDGSTRDVVVERETGYVHP